MISPVKRVLHTTLTALLLLSITGCWNYKEVDSMAIVAGVAIDKNQSDGKLLLTAEIIKNKGGTENTLASSETISLSGNTMFDIVRNMISITGRKLFWSHAKVIVLSKEIARSGVVKVIDWYNRDTETRSDVYIMISKEKTAKEVLVGPGTSNLVKSFDLQEMMRDEISLNTSPIMEIWDFLEKLESTGESASVPTIQMQNIGGKKVPRVNGTAVFSRDKMVGTLNGKESQYALIARNKLQGGVLVVKGKHKSDAYTLEILSNRTKVQPEWANGRLKIRLTTTTVTNLDEVRYSEDFSKPEVKKAIEQRAARQLQSDILAVIHKVQKKYRADIFSFGEIVHEQMPGSWKHLRKNWRKNFAELDVSVKSKVIIKSTAKTQRPIRVGD